MPFCSMSHVLGARQLGERWGCNGDLEDRKIRKPLAETLAELQQIGRFCVSGGGP